MGGYANLAYSIVFFHCSSVRSNSEIVGTDGQRQLHDTRARAYIWKPGPGADDLVMPLRFDLNTAKLGALYYSV